MATWDLSLTAMGFSPFFRQQLTLEEIQACGIGHVWRVERSGLTVGTERGERRLPLGGHWLALPPEQRPTVGDWVVLDPDLQRVLRVLERKSVFKRMAAGDRVDVQLIAANVDTAFIVSSCNAEFNPSRLERYLAWALDAGVEAVLVLTKADLAEDAERYRSAAHAVRRDLPIELVNAHDPEDLAGVRAWCRPGQIVALTGSSGVGKSTLLNTLTGTTLQPTGSIREADARGRHTTTGRSLHRLPNGAWLLDSPGMRELALAGGEHGTAQLFKDLDELTARCRFGDCSHASEPGCAVREALARGELDERRLTNYRKLLREEARARESLAERHRRVRAFAKKVRKVVEAKHRRR